MAKTKHTKSGIIIPNGWQYLPFGNVFEFVQSMALSREQLTLEETENNIYNIHYGDIHATYKSEILDFDSEKRIPKIKDDAISPKALTFLKEGDLIIADASEDYDGVAACVEIFNLKKKKAIGGLHTFVARDNSGLTTTGFRSYIFKHPGVNTELKKLATGSKVYGISKTNLAKLYVLIPPPQLQIKIVRILSAYNSAIEKQKHLIAAKEKQKKAMMKKVLSGTKRFEGFFGEWEEIQIGELLDYEQPNKYTTNNIFENTNGGVPVLTANKSFILGYTDDTEGIYNRLPVIIFDDFTTDSKFVDFDFKIKSSAIKLLKPKNKNVNLKFVYEKMREITTSIGEHKRRYISEYQFNYILMPTKVEQDKIELFINLIDEELVALNKELSALKDQKEGMIQQLLTGKILAKP